MDLLNAMKANHSGIVNVEPSVDTIEKAQAEEDAPKPRKSFAKRLLPFSGTYSPDNIFLMLLRPFTILFNPAIIWSTLFLSITTAWFVVISFVIAQIFSGPPYLLDSAHIGYMSAGPCIGGILGSIACGLMSDPLAIFLAKRNKGVYEPEFRLILLLPFVVTASIGFFCFGNFAEQGYSPAVMSVIWGIALAAQQFMSVAIGTYVIDAYREISVEVFIIGMVVKNFLFFGLSCESRNASNTLEQADFVVIVGVNDWVTRWGPARVFDTIGGIEVALFFLSFPVWVWGKQWRAYFHSKHIS